MTNNTLTLFLALTLMSSSMTPLFASTEKTIDEKNPIHVSFSKNTHNRISLESGAVLKVIADPTIFSVNIDKDTGHAFINVLRDCSDTPSTLTVIASSGFVQDLIVHSREGLLEHLILQESGEDDTEELSQESLVKIPTIEFLNTILEGGVPRGYGERPPLDSDSLTLPSPLHSYPVKVLENPHETIVIYSLENTGKVPAVISTESLKQKNTSWVFLNAHELKRHEKVLCLMAFNKQGTL